MRLSRFSRPSSSRSACSFSQSPASTADMPSGTARAYLARDDEAWYPDRAFAFGPRRARHTVLYRHRGQSRITPVASRRSSISQRECPQASSGQHYAGTCQLALPSARPRRGPTPGQHRLAEVLCPSAAVWWPSPGEADCLGGPPSPALRSPGLARRPAVPRDLLTTVVTPGTAGALQPAVSISVHSLH